MANATVPRDFAPQSGSVAGFGRLSRLGLYLLIYTVAVVLWGALVRVTGSGDGCGQHWPTCQGEITHFPERLEEALEYGHRLTSGLVLVFGIGFAWLLRRRLSASHRAYKAVLVALAFTLIDAAIGARLVLGALVGLNTSPARAVIMPAHLVSTCGLSAGFVLAAFWADEGPKPGLTLAASRTLKLVLAGLVFSFVVVAAMGAVTALGDTLYPVSAGNMAARVNEDQGTTAHFLQRLRVVHPLLAASFGLALLFAVPRLVSGASAFARRFAALLRAAVLLELGLGVVNVLLSAPALMQLVHLAAAVALWLALVLTAAEVLAPRAAHGPSVT